MRFWNESAILQLWPLQRNAFTKTPGVCGGCAHIAGHRVRVLDIAVWHEHLGWSPDEIVSHVPSVTLADVHAALAYYYDRREEIHQEIRAEREMAEEVRRDTPSAVRAKLMRASIPEAS